MYIIVHSIIQYKLHFTNHILMWNINTKHHPIFLKIFALYSFTYLFKNNFLSQNVLINIIFLYYDQISH